MYRIDPFEIDTFEKILSLLILSRLILAMIRFDYIQRFKFDWKLTKTRFFKNRDDFEIVEAISASRKF